MKQKAIVGDDWHLAARTATLRLTGDGGPGTPSYLHARSAYHHRRRRRRGWTAWRKSRLFVLHYLRLHVNQHVTQRARWRARSHSRAKRANRLFLSSQLLNQNLSPFFFLFFLNGVTERIVACTAGGVLRSSIRVRGANVEWTSDLCREAKRVLQISCKGCGTKNKKTPIFLHNASKCHC